MTIWPKSGSPPKANTDEECAAAAQKLLRLAQKHDLGRQGKELPAHVRAHVTNASSKGELRAILLEQAEPVGREIGALRAQLDYPAGPPAGRTVDATLARRWLRATTASSSAE